RNSLRQRPACRTLLGVDVLEDRNLLSVASPPDSVLPAGASPIDVQLGRIDADAAVDLAALDASGRVTVALNRGDDSWRTPQTLALHAGPGSGLLLAPLDNDAFADLLVQGPDQLTLARGDGAGNFSVVQTLTPTVAGQLAPAGGGRVRMASGLFDGDF